MMRRVAPPLQSGQTWTRDSRVAAVRHWCSRHNTEDGAIHIAKVSDMFAHLQLKKWMRLARFCLHRRATRRSQALLTCFALAPRCLQARPPLRPRQLRASRRRIVQRSRSGQTWTATSRAAAARRWCSRPPTAGAATPIARASATSVWPPPRRRTKTARSSRSPVATRRSRLPPTCSALATRSPEFSRTAAPRPRRASKLDGSYAYLLPAGGGGSGPFGSP
mmetsp:Transcript_65368/g.164725  ORF Transcript_65368/g.164725 Transcript_65368/m.164725 type:complete len:221 (+) Transcript_65368:213-875(+)